MNRTKIFLTLTADSQETWRADGDASPADAASHGHVKRRKVSAESFFAPRVAGAAKAAATPIAQPPADGEDVPHADELAAYHSRLSAVPTL